MLIQGGDMRISVGGKLIFHAQNASMSIQRETKEVASKDTNGKLKSLGAITWGASGSALGSDAADAVVATHVDPSALLQYLLDGTLVDYSFTDKKSGNMVLTGQVYVTQFNVNANNEEEVSYDYTFDGTGDLTKAAVA